MKYVTPVRFTRNAARGYGCMGDGCIKISTVENGAI